MIKYLVKQQFSYHDNLLIVYDQLWLAFFTGPVIVKKIDSERSVWPAVAQVH